MKEAQKCKPFCFRKFLIYVAIEMNSFLPYGYSLKHISILLVDFLLGHVSPEDHAGAKDEVQRSG